MAHLRDRLGPFVRMLASAWLVSSAAMAEPSEADLARARRLFQEAAALEHQQEWRKASEKLRAALAVKETPGLHFHLAHCAEQLGELVLAARHYELAEDLIRAGAEAPDVEELLTAARTRVLSRLPRLTLELPGGLDEATIEVDGAPLRQPPGTPVLLDPGRHRIVARAPGRRDFELEIVLAEGQAQTLEVALAPVPSRADESVASGAEPASRNERASDRSGLDTRELVLIGEAALTLAGLGVGVGYSLARSSASDRVERSQRAVDAASPDGRSGCEGEAPPRACAELDAAIDDHALASRVATIGFVAAGAGAAAALLTWALWPDDSARAKAMLEPAPGGGVRASVVGRF